MEDRERQVIFGAFRLDLPTGRLWRGEQEIGLRARSRAVLAYLAAHPGRVISREEFIQHAWNERYISQTVLRVCMWEIRQALGDSVAHPQYIETVGQQGYRFVAAPSEDLTERSTADVEGAEPPTPAAPFVGRQSELAVLQDCLTRAQRGVPQLVLVAGELGVGKSTLVQQFLTRLLATAPMWVGQGQCIDHAGPGEAYLPLLQALSHLARGPGGERLIAALRQMAPMWLVQLPMLVQASELEMLQRQVQGASQARMIRELGDVLGAVSRDTVLVLVLEDLHWSDASTVDGLASLARRAEGLRLLLVGTYRPAEVAARGHTLRPVVQELGAHGLCQELNLEPLTPAEVQTYVVQRFGASPSIAQLGASIHRCTEGNALFVVHVLDHLRQQGLLRQEGSQWILHGEPTIVEEQVPRSLQPLLLKQVEALTTDAQQCLAAASVAGMDFTAAEVAAGLQHPIETVEAVCDDLSRQGQLIEPQGVVSWPDGTMTARYRFQHAMYHHLLYAQLGQGQRVRLHYRLGERLETAYGQQGHEMASVLAYHFGQGQDARRAVQYHGRAAVRALHRNGYPEALLHCQRGLDGLKAWPETPERQRQELALRMCLSAVLTATQGHAAPALQENLQRAQALCQEVEEIDEVEEAAILVGLTRLSMNQGNREVTEALMAQEQALLERLRNPAALVQLHTQLGTCELFRGKYACALEHHTHAQRLYEAPGPPSLVLAFGGDPTAVALGMSGWSLWLSGWPEQSWHQAQRALKQAEMVGHSLTLANVLFLAAHVRQFRGELEAAWALGQRLVSLARQEGFALYEAGGEILQGWLLVQQGELAHGEARITRALAHRQVTGSQLFLPFFMAFLVEAALRQGKVAEGLCTVAKALRLTATHFDRFWEAELYRLRGELLLAQARVQPAAHGVRAAVASFQQALDIARAQAAKALELRAALSLSRLWQGQGKSDEARSLLAAVYEWFTEGKDTADLMAARALIAECSA